MKVLVIGSDMFVSEQLAQVDRSSFNVVIGVNKAAIDYGPVDIHCTLHPEKYAPSVSAPVVVSNKKAKGVHKVISSLWWPGGDSGSSGLLAVKYALEKLDAESVVLAGVGMSDIPHYYNPSQWHAAKRFQQTWTRVADKLRGKVYSLGGWTAELLNDSFDFQPPVIPVSAAGRVPGQFNQKETDNV